MEDNSSSSIPSPNNVSAADVVPLRRMHRFNCFQDIMLLTNVCELNPLEDRNIWESVTAKVSEVMPFFSTRCCKERMLRLLNYYKMGNDASLRRGGSDEDLTEKKRLLQEIKELQEDVGVGNKVKGQFPRRNLDEQIASCRARVAVASLDMDIQHYNKGNASTDSSEELSGGEGSEPSTTPGVKRKLTNSRLHYGASQAKRSAVSDFSSLADVQLKFRMEELDVQKRKLDLNERKLELEMQRFELEKQEKREDRKMMLRLLELALKRYDK